MDKRSFYQNTAQQIAALVNDEPDLIANMANISAVLFNQMDDVNWAGFYLYKDDQLVLGPFQGQPACIRIPMGKGVCGSAAQQQKAFLVEDVHAFDGHIACDAASNSEVVIPIVKNGQLVGVLDIDSPVFARFDKVDEEGLAHIVDILLEQIA